MILHADTHVHVYPEFDPRAVFTRALQNLGAGSGRDAGILLTEREGDHWFRDLLENPKALPQGLHAEPLPDGSALWLGNDADQRLLVVPGRQFVSRERVEVLCLTRDLAEGDGTAASGLIESIRAAGGVPVLPWSPGKWLGSRGRTVRALVASASPGQLVMGDIAMRPRVGIEPAAFRLARSRGIGLVAGTDPLPLPGDESIIGRYGVAIDCDPDHLVDGIRAGLTDPAEDIPLIGRRSPVLQSLRRWIALKRR